jgi:hypothetical protein
MRDAVQRIVAQSGAHSAVVAVTGDHAMALSSSQAMAPSGVATFDAFSTGPTDPGPLEPSAPPAYAPPPHMAPFPIQTWPSAQLPPRAPIPYGPSYPMPPPASSGGAWALLAAGLGMLVLLMGAGGVWLLSNTRQRSFDDDVAPPSATPPPPPREQSQDEPGSVAPLPPESTPSEKRVKACAGLRAIRKPQLKKHLQDMGWQVSGTLIYCPGNMINFRCVGVQTDGVTVEHGGDANGSLSLLRFPTAAKANRYVDSEAAGVTLLTDGATVLRVDMPSAAADDLTKRVCR